MANGDKKKGIKAKDRFVSKKVTVKKTGKKPVYKATVTKKKVPAKAKVTLGKKKPVTKYNIVIKSKTGTRRLPTRTATGVQAKKLAAAGKKKKK
jgi:hypothetical protein